MNSGTLTVILMMLLALGVMLVLSWGFNEVVSEILDDYRTLGGRLGGE